ncbi:hypothetical protein [Herbaspirillum sp.]|uniref:hypothetical protein n=1 Tax=Herbaspirillum sp. TaxID=1890675 RepID=UPI000C099751|nr:hypothetical protein [Herbaspirillum sp.]MAF04394.1 hypothetical protein [Herbaspirillum sp.]|tara:strand:- start:40011 stop:40208 length:198 start_codon:yes stop_codon:yes gene_type:complete
MTSGDSPGSKEMSRHGFGLCDRERSQAHYRSMTAERECGKFEEAAADVLAQRIRWMERKNGKEAA